MTSFEDYRRFKLDRRKLVVELERLSSWLKRDIERGDLEDEGFIWIPDHEDFIKLRAESKIEDSCLFFTVRAEKYGVFVEKSDDFGSTGK